MVDAKYSPEKVGPGAKSWQLGLWKKVPPQMGRLTSVMCQERKSATSKFWGQLMAASDRISATERMK